MTLKELGITQEEMSRYVNGEEIDPDKELLIEKHWFGSDYIENACISASDFDYNNIDEALRKMSRYKAK